MNTIFILKRRIQTNTNYKVIQVAIGEITKETKNYLFYEFAGKKGKLKKTLIIDTWNPNSPYTLQYALEKIITENKDELLKIDAYPELPKKFAIAK